jgi:UDP-N-acetylglucosamine 2-epimerase (non-hydrolysing)
MLDAAVTAMRILNVVGARPNFVKIAPLLREMRRDTRLEPLLVHTGQHYGERMSDPFFADLEIAPPDFHLGVGSGSHAAQTAEVMRRIEPVMETARPDVLVVVGDVNSTLAAALTAVKLGVPIAHVEAGLRSFDRRMPEEINRRLTDAISDVLFVTEDSARDNLLREGVDTARVHFVGNVMIDALEIFRPRWEASPIHAQLGLERDEPYAVLTLHRPSNVDDPAALARLIDALQELGRELPILFPVHPRVAQRLAECDAPAQVPTGDAPVNGKGIVYLTPLGYLDFVALVSRARLVLTDSGGIQEETTILGVPCLTLREHTERPVTVTHGTNRIIGTDPARIVAEALCALDSPPAAAGIPALWDGRAAQRIVRVLVDRYATRSTSAR